MLGRQAVPFWNGPLSHDTLNFRGGFDDPIFRYHLCQVHITQLFKRGVYDTICDQISVTNPPLLCYVLGSHDAGRVILYIYTIDQIHTGFIAHVLFGKKTSVRHWPDHLYKHQVWDLMFKSIWDHSYTQLCDIYDYMIIYQSHCTKPFFLGKHGYTPKNYHGNWTWTPGRGDSY